MLFKQNMMESKILKVKIRTIQVCFQSWMQIFGKACLVCAETSDWGLLLAQYQVSSYV